MLPSVEYLRVALRERGFARLTGTMGEVWGRGETFVTVGANEIVIASQPSIHRRFNRASGGLALAIEYVKGEAQR